MIVKIIKDFVFDNVKMNIPVGACLVSVNRFLR